MHFARRNNDRLLLNTVEMELILLRMVNGLDDLSIGEGY
jgi:hypothetical protein